MIFEILNVGHGFCAYLAADNENLMVFDCGHSAETDIFPSNYLRNKGFQKIDYFFVMNYDEDHISDLPNLRRNFKILTLVRNPSITTQELRNLKLQRGLITNAMNEFLRMSDQYIYTSINNAYFPNVNVQIFHNNYKCDFLDTNNISLVVFLTCGKTKFVLAGDLEKEGWRCLLLNPEFITQLVDVNVFVASHHGRESGYCPEVFNICRPDVIVFSDGPQKYQTQEMAAIYGQHAGGVCFKGQVRKVLSTRNDGNIPWYI